MQVQRSKKIGWLSRRTKSSLEDAARRCDSLPVKEKAPAEKLEASKTDPFELPSFEHPCAKGHTSSSYLDESFRLDELVDERTSSKKKVPGKTAQSIPTHSGHDIRAVGMRHDNCRGDFTASLSCHTHSVHSRGSSTLMQADGLDGENSMGHGDSLTAELTSAESSLVQQEEREIIDRLLSGKDRGSSRSSSRASFSASSHSRGGGRSRTLDGTGRESTPASFSVSNCRGGTVNYNHADLRDAHFDARMDTSLPSISAPDSFQLQPEVIRRVPVQLRAPPPPVTSPPSVAGSRTPPPSGHRAPIRNPITSQDSFLSNDSRQLSSVMGDSIHTFQHSEDTTLTNEELDRMEHEMMELALRISRTDV